MGGYGNFGKRIAENLSTIANIKLVIAGRHILKAQKSCDQLIADNAVAEITPSVIDINTSNLNDQISTLTPDLVIHTCGPFQNQDYRVAQACIAAGSHYIDLADDRRFVCDIDSLNEKAKKKGVLLISGASSVPGLSSTVVDHYSRQFSRLDIIDSAIAPGNQAERGKATIQGILSYTGHPFHVLRNSQWCQQYGWLSPKTDYFDETIGYRSLANVDIPDLELFPKRYASVKTVNFQAGLELRFLHYTMVVMAYMAKIGLVKDWSSFTGLISRASDLFLCLGTDIGGMKVVMTGLGNDRKPKKIQWVLGAKSGVGPYIPTIPAIVMAKKIIHQAPGIAGAKPCMGLFTLADFENETKDLDIYMHQQVTHG